MSGGPFAAIRHATLGAFGEALTLNAGTAQAVEVRGVLSVKGIDVFGVVTDETTLTIDADAAEGLSIGAAIAAGGRDYVVRALDPARGGLVGVIVGAA